MAAAAVALAIGNSPLASPYFLLGPTGARRASISRNFRSTTATVSDAAPSGLERVLGEHPSGLRSCQPHFLQNVRICLVIVSKLVCSDLNLLNSARQSSEPSLLETHSA
jgi:hypothetical protein